MAGSIVVREVSGRRGIKDWLAVPFTVFSDDPAWVPPLLFVERQRISSDHNPFFTFGEAAFFVAYRNGSPVGRISAQVNRRHLAQHKDQAGHFGFFACIEDQEVAAALMAAARGWLKDRGMARMAGPFSLSINEDVGLLIHGFETSPSILSSHARPWFGGFLESIGLAKAVDLFAYRMNPEDLPEPIVRLAQLARGQGNLNVRHFDMRQYDRDVAIVFEIFNEAWSDNWGFVPFAPTEVAKLTSDTRLFMRGEYGRIVEIDGKPMAMMVLLPDLNTMTRSYRGRMLPFNWLKFLYGLKFDRWSAARVALLGLRQELRPDPLAPAVLSLLVREALELRQRYRIDWLELSWVVETNRPMVRLAELAAGPPCRVYRVYEQAV